MPEVAAVALGSNLGNREKNLLEAIERVRALEQCGLCLVFMTQRRWGIWSKPRFLNGALLLETSLAPLQLMRGLLAVELAMGRSRLIAKGPRVIDLDLLLYGDVVMSTDELMLPHPAMMERQFVLEPLAEIASEMVHPVSRSTVAPDAEKGLNKFALGRSGESKG